MQVSKLFLRIVLLSLGWSLTWASSSSTQYRVEGTQPQPAPTTGTYYVNGKYAILNLLS